MMLRVVLALAVLTATVFWADCGFCVCVQGGGGGCPCPPAPPPAWNSFFAGCFTGKITDPAGTGDVIVRIDASTDPNDKVTLNGCMRVTPSGSGGSIEEGTFSGDVKPNDSTTQVTLKVMANPEFSVLVTRAPDGNEQATSLNLTDAGSAPFVSANNLSSCTMTCADLGISVPFLPAGGGQ